MEPLPDSSPPPFSALRAAQQAVVEAGAGTTRAAWAPRTGKTTALVHRAARLLGGGESVLVLTRDVPAASRVEQAVLTVLGGPVDGLTVATFTGLCRAVAGEALPGHRVLRRDEQRRFVATLVATERDDPALAAHWPVSGPLLGRAAFAGELADALLAYQRSFLGAEELRTHASATAAPERWHELAAFSQRYEAALAARHLLDEAAVLVATCLHLREAGAAATFRARHRHLLVDDGETLTAAAFRLLTIVAGPATAPAGDIFGELGTSGASLVVAGNPAGVPGDTSGTDWFGLLPRRFHPVTEVPADPAAGTVAPTRRLVRVHHRAVEPEAVAGALLDAHAMGQAWRDLAVLAPGPRRLPDIARALRRHGVPARDETRTPSHALLGSPGVTALLALLRYAAGDDAALVAVLGTPLDDTTPDDRRWLHAGDVAGGGALDAVRHVGDEMRTRLTAGRDGARPHALALDVWDGLLGSLLVADDTAVEPVRLVIDALADFEGTLPEWLALLDAEGPAVLAGTRGRRVDDGADAVTLTVVDNALGRAWDTVVVVGCNDGELPRTGVRVAYFDRALLTGGPDTPPLHERQRALLDRERRRFELACARATRHVVAVAAPEPGVLESRFVEGWERAEPALPARPPGAPAPARLVRTTGTAPVWPERALRLSATQLDAYENCPWNYAHQYVLGVRGEGGVQAQFGSLVHRIFETFLRPGSGPRTFERLLAVADEAWDPGIFPYRPQATDYRRRLHDLLTAWWERDGVDRAEVVAVEHRFTVPAGPHTLTGSIDRVDRTDSGLEIVDYKTSAKVPRDALDSVQLAVYLLAATRDPSLAALGPVTRMRFDYLVAGRHVAQWVSDDLVDATEQRVLEVANAILDERFTPSTAASCDYCDFKRVCPLQDEGREVESRAPLPAPKRRSNAKART